MRSSFELVAWTMPAKSMIAWSRISIGRVGSFQLCRDVELEQTDKNAAKNRTIYLWVMGRVGSIQQSCEMWRLGSTCTINSSSWVLCLPKWLKSRAVKGQYRVIQSVRCADADVIQNSPRALGLTEVGSPSSHKRSSLLELTPHPDIPSTDGLICKTSMEPLSHGPESRRRSRNLDSRHHAKS